MPGTWIEITQSLVLHLVHFSKYFDANQVAIAMIGCDIVADHMPAGAPNQMNLVEREEIGRLADLRPFEHLEGDVMQLRLLVDDKVERVMVGVAAQEIEIVAA